MNVSTKINVENSENTITASLIIAKAISLHSIVRVGII